jgi:hypothetical protein
VTTAALSPGLAALRDQLLASGFAAGSPDSLGPEAERLAREERWS